MLKRIFIGVAIGVILMSFKSCKAHAYINTSYSNYSNIIVDMSLDYCKDLEGTAYCVPYRDITHDVITGGSIDVDYANVGDVIALRTLAIKFVFNTPLQFDSSNIFLVGDLGNGIDTFNSLGGFFGSVSPTRSIYKLNQTLVKAEFTLNDNSVITIEGSSNIGMVYSTYNTNNYVVAGGGKVPSTLKNKIVKDMTFYYQPTITSIGGSMSKFFETFPTYTTLPNFSDFISQRNNSYLLVWSGQTIILKRPSNYPFRLSSYSFYGNTQTAESVEIEQSFANIQKELTIAQMSYGSGTPSNEEYDEFTSSLSSEWSYLQTSLNTDRNFTAFLEALVNGPIIKLQNSLQNYDVYDSPNNYYYASHTRCVSAPYRIRIWPKDDNTDDFSFNFPCMTDFYAKMHDRHNNYGFFEDYTEHTGFSFASIYAMLLHGWLSYLLILTYLNIVKMTITPNKSEIEVLEL